MLPFCHWKIEVKKPLPRPKVPVIKQGPPEVPLTLGQQLRDRRRALNLSQTTFGRMVGVSRRTVQNWEADLDLPDLDRRPQIAAILCWPPQSFGE